MWPFSPAKHQKTRTCDGVALSGGDVPLDCGARAEVYRVLEDISEGYKEVHEQVSEFVREKKRAPSLAARASRTNGCRLMSTRTANDQQLSEHDGEEVLAIGEIVLEFVALLLQDFERLVRNTSVGARGAHRILVSALK